MSAATPAPDVSSTLSGVRIASVGVATFSVSLVGALLLVLLAVGYYTRQRWLGLAGAALLAAVVAVFAATPRLTAASAAALASATPSSLFTINIGVTAFVLVSGVVLAAVAVLLESFAPRNAKLIG
jgi:hypothetical protein